MGTQKGRLFELARIYHTYKRKNVRERKPANKKDVVHVKGEHFDEGKSISLSYSFDMYPEVLRDSHERQSQASQMGFFEMDKSEAFYVEPFDVEETVEVPYREVREGDDDARLESIARGFSSQSEIERMEEDVEKMKDMEEKLDKVFEPEEESSAMESGDSAGMKAMAGGPPQQPVGGKQAQVPDKIEPEVKPYEASDEEFARDIGAILQGQKVYNAEQKKAIDRGGSGAARKKEPDFPAKSGTPAADMLDPGKNEHMIFEKIAQSMAFANSYDLGAIALSRKFDLMDQEIEKEEVNTILHNKRPGHADDADVIEADPSPVTAEAVSMGVEKYGPHVALDNRNGGRLIGEDVLQKGDLILTSSSGAFDIIDGTLGSESIAGVYLGGNKLLTKGDGGILEEKALQPHIGSKGVMVALRHQGMSEEKATSIVDGLTKLRPGPEKNEAENWLRINCPTISLHPDVCNDEHVSDKKKCGAFAGRIYLGTMNNDSFTCAESIVNAFDKNQLPFAPLLSKEHNGSLKYLGHLKNKI